MDSPNQINKKDSKMWYFRTTKERHYDVCDIYTTLDQYKKICKKMEDKEWIWISQGVIEDTLLSLKFREEYGIEYTIRVSFAKPIDNYQEEREAEQQNIINWRKSSFIFNNHKC